MVNGPRKGTACDNWPLRRSNSSAQRRTSRPRHDRGGGRGGGGKFSDSVIRSPFGSELVT